MIKLCPKRIIILLLIISFMIIYTLPPFTIVAYAKDGDNDAGDKTSTEIADGWGFNTKRPTASQERETLGENPVGAKEDTVTIFGEAPLEIAVVGSRIFNSPGIYNRDDRGDIYYYNDIGAMPGILSFGNSGVYNNVPDITCSTEKDVRPATTIAVDMDGDGIDEIVRYFIDIDYQGSDPKKLDGDIKNFNDGVPGYSAVFWLHCINSQTGTIIDRVKLRTVSKSAIPDFYIPDSVYYWSSYLQMTAGDFDGDGKEEIAVAVPGKSRDYGNIYIFGMDEVGNDLRVEYLCEHTYYSCYGAQDSQRQFTAFHLTSGDTDNDKIDELVYTFTLDVLTVDENSVITITDYKDGVYTSTTNTIRFGTREHFVGNAGVTVGDIDNDGLNEIVVGGYMVNKNAQDALYIFTGVDGKRQEFAYYHELAMSYIEHNQNTNTYGIFKGFTVFREEEDAAWTAASGNNTRYNDASGKNLSNSDRYGNAQNWTLPIQSVSLTGYINGRTNDQIFFGNCMYYYNTGSGKFEVYNDSGKASGSTFAYDSFNAPFSVITALIPGNYLDPNPYYVKSEGRQQLLVSYTREIGNTQSFEIAIMYESSAGTSMDVKKVFNFIGGVNPAGFNQRDYYPTVCAPNMDNDAVFVQYAGYAFSYSVPEILAVLASLPYYEDIYNAYPSPVYEPGSTSLSKSSGGSYTKTSTVEFSMGWYLSFEQDLSIFGAKITSIEAELVVSLSTSSEFSDTVERESSVTYETNGGQDSVVMVSSPLDLYYYRYYEESDDYAMLYPDAIKSDPSTWGFMAVTLSSEPQTLVFPVETYNELAEKYGMNTIDSDFWMHTQGDPGTYPTSIEQFKNAKDILSSSSSMSATSGSGSVGTELAITESTESAYAFSLTAESRMGLGVGGFTTGPTFGCSIGGGGTVVNFRGTTIGASLCNFPNDADFVTTGYSLTTRLHSYTTEFNNKDIMVLYYTVSQVRGSPKLPSSFYADERTTESIKLAWDVPEIISPPLRPDYYKLYRYDNYYNEWLLLDDDIPVNSGAYIDKDVYLGETYKYRMEAVVETGYKTSSMTLETSTLPMGEPPVITVQPRDTTVAAGGNVSFSIEAKLPENTNPNRLYYQWYQRESADDSWIAVSGSPGEKILILSDVTLAMDGCEYYCKVTRLLNNKFPLSVNSAYARLAVTEQGPQLYTVNYASGINGNVTAFEIGAGGNYEISSGSGMFEQTKIIFTAEPDIGYRVSQWTINRTPVGGDTGNTFIINSLSEDVAVDVSFTYSAYNITFDIAENLDENQGDEVWGSISAKYGENNVLPQGEVTLVAAQSPITFTAVPAVAGDKKYSVKQWIKNGEIIKNYNGSIFAGKTYIIETLLEDTVVEVMFGETVECNIEVSSEIANNDVAYFNNEIITIYGEDGLLVKPGDSVTKGSRITIEVMPPNSALIYSWEIAPVDEMGNALAEATILGSQSSYTIDELSSSCKIKITYIIVSTKTVVFDSEGGNGTVTASAGVGNTELSGVVMSGGKVQMYSDVVFTAYPNDEALGVKGWTVNDIYEDNDVINYTLRSINRNTMVKVLFETAPEAKVSIDAIEIKAGETVAVDANDIASDADGDILTVSGIIVLPAAGIAGAELGEGENDGKAFITGVNEGATSAVLAVSDGKGHTCDVIMPIKVSNNQQSPPFGLEGKTPAHKDDSDGKITGLIPGKTYEYKPAASMGDYKEVTADEQSSEITGLTAGTYLVRFAAIAGYYTSKSVEVEVPQYIPKSIAELEALSYKVGDAAEMEVPDFNGNTVTYYVVLDDYVENGTEINLSGIPAADSGVAVTETVSGILRDGAASAKITVTAEDEVTNKTYTVNFTAGEAPGDEPGNEPGGDGDTGGDNGTGGNGDTGGDNGTGGNDDTGGDSGIGDDNGTGGTNGKDDGDSTNSTGGTDVTGDDGDGSNVEPDADTHTKTIETIIPKSSITLMAESGIEVLTVSTPVASITFSNKALSTISDEASGDVKITTSRIDSSTLSDEFKQIVGDRPVFDFSVTSGDRSISQFGGNIEVSVPYTPKEDEDTNAIIIYYINAESELGIIGNCAYNPETGTLSFKTNHLSTYAVGYNKINFNDVAANAWYSDAVGFIAARDITKGTGGNNYEPEWKLTRGQFIVMLMRTYDIRPDKNPKDNFSDAGNTYYTNYLASAKQLGIAKGIGNNMYAPDKEITRQEMFTLLYNALNLIGELPENKNGKELNDFSDSSQIADWALQAMELFVETGTICGNGGMLSPLNTANRAEMAQMLYRLLLNQIGLIPL